MTTLYHYTNAAGLAGILSEKAFWASEYRFLNDSTEFTYGWHLIFDALIEADAEIRSISREASDLIGTLGNDINQSSMYGFVASLTTQGDLLSQWRGYNNGKGFSLGINLEWLKQNAFAQGFALAPVEYNEEAQRKLISELIDVLIKLISMTVKDPNSIEKMTHSWWRQILQVAFSFKNNHFAEEQEYRLFHIVDTWPTALKVRTGPHGLIPYIPCKFDTMQPNTTLSHPSNCGLEKIILGPGVRANQKIGVDALLATHHMRFEIVESEIPYVAD